ncbi:MAG: NAD(P)/FAD-dependent oxidoreductase [Candidatus Micrarchaeia archaeon]
MEEKELVIIGAGAAGLTAAIFTARRKIPTTVVSIEIGGQTAIPISISNYPGVGTISGSALMEKIREQAAKEGVEFVFGKVSGVGKRASGGFEVKLSNGLEIAAKAVILAFGKAPRTLGIEGEDAYMGNGIFTSVVHDPKFYEGRTVGVIGGGNSAFGTALECAESAEKVYIINRTEKFRGEETTLEKIRQTRNIELLTNRLPHAFSGDGKWLREITTKDAVTGEIAKIAIDMAFVNIGLETKNDFCASLVRVNEHKEIVIDANCRTGVDGLFACGDATSIPYKQTVISAGEGAKAAIEAYKFLKGDYARTSNDWTH